MIRKQISFSKLYEAKNVKPNRNNGQIYVQKRSTKTRTVL